MTTIAYKDGIVAFDSQITYCSTFIGNTKFKAKKYKFKDRTFILAATGTAFSCERLLKWAGTNFDPEQKPDEENSDVIDAFYITNKNELYLVDGTYNSWRIDLDTFSIGNGSDLALGAMSYGATAVEAIKIAIKLNVYTGGKVRKLTIKFKEE